MTLQRLEEARRRLRAGLPKSPEEWTLALALYFVLGMVALGFLTGFMNDVRAAGFDVNREQEEER